MPIATALTRVSSTRDASPFADRLLEAAEALYGRHGLDGVSLRQIGAAAGSSNNYAVQYHFANAEGLIRAILARRMPTVDARQAVLMAQVEAKGQVSDVRAVVDVFFRPLLEQVNEQGERSYARFMSALLRSSEGVDHCRALFHLTPSTERILAWLHAASPHVPHEVLRERLRLMCIMVYTSIFNRLVPPEGDACDVALIDDALDTAAAGLVVPYRPRRGLSPSPFTGSLRDEP